MNIQRFNVILALLVGAGIAEASPTAAPATRQPPLPLPPSSPPPPWPPTESVTLTGTLEFVTLDTSTGGYYALRVGDSGAPGSRPQWVVLGSAEALDDLLLRERAFPGSLVEVGGCQVDTVARRQQEGGGGGRLRCMAVGYVRRLDLASEDAVPRVVAGGQRAVVMSVGFAQDRDDCRGLGASSTEDDLAIRDFFSRISAFFRECSYGLFSVDLDGLQVPPTGEASPFLYRPELPCRREYCSSDIYQLANNGEVFVDVLSRLGALQRPAQDAIKSFFLPPAASQLGCDWRGMSLRQSRQVFLRYRQPWLMMHEWLHVYGLGHAGEGGSILGDADPTRDQADPTSCMGCELCVQQDWLRVCANAPQNRYLGWGGPVPGGELDAASLPPGVRIDLELPSQHLSNASFIRIVPTWLDQAGRHTHNLYLSYRLPFGGDVGLNAPDLVGKVLVHRIDARRDVRYTGPRGQTHGDTQLLRDSCMRPNEDRDVPELGLWLQAAPSPKAATLLVTVCRYNTTASAEQCRRRAAQPGGLSNNSSSSSPLPAPPRQGSASPPRPSQPAPRPPTTARPRSPRLPASPLPSPPRPSSPPLPLRPSPPPSAPSSTAAALLVAVCRYDNNTLVECRKRRGQQGAPSRGASSGPPPSPPRQSSANPPRRAQPAPTPALPPHPSPQQPAPPQPGSPPPPLRPSPNPRPPLLRPPSPRPPLPLESPLRPRPRPSLPSPAPKLPGPSPSPALPSQPPPPAPNPSPPSPAASPELLPSPAKGAQGPPSPLNGNGSAVLLTAGREHTCAWLTANWEGPAAAVDDGWRSVGSVICWGSNTFGQLALQGTPGLGARPGQMGAALPPVDLGLGLQAVAVAAGRGHTCAVLQPGGIVKCWGEDSLGRLGRDPYTSDDGSSGGTGPPLALGRGLTAVALTAAPYHTCALLQPGGLVKCWGFDTLGLLGHGDAYAGYWPYDKSATLPAVDLGPGLTAVAVAAGESHTCALLQPGGIVKCWGNGDQLGIGENLWRGDVSSKMGAALPRVDLGRGLTAVALTAGGYHTCALLQPGGLVKCWGRNNHGQLGLGDTKDRGGRTWEMGAALRPVDLGPGLTAVALAAGAEHTCALLQPGGIVKCWGHNDYGQLGQGDTVHRGEEPGQMGAALPPVDLGPGLTVVAVTAGEYHTCAVLQPGNVVKCWGNNANGQLGLGDTLNRGNRPGQMGAALPPVDLDL